ncbi:MAG: sugar ABC transporter ATP-binding protein, partial [Planctomycetes bacterium]|nr:sugar ABC transporter ATP-binding protein [Planctomycetota bacterium]
MQKYKRSRLMQPGVELVRMESIVKTFPGVKALSGVNFSVLSGECHALVGENGAGKSTLIKILMGAYTKDSGTIVIDGKETEIQSAIHAKALGLGAVYQDIMLAQHLSVAENFFLGQLPRTAFGLVDWKRARGETEQALAALGIELDARLRIKDLSTAQQEMVAIAKAVKEQAKVVVFDAPPALLTTAETKILFSLICQLKKSGIGIIYISHRMEEIFEICDRVTVLKDGEYVGTVAVKDTDEDALVKMMVGRGIDDMYNIALPEPAEPICEVRDFSSGSRFRNINFTVRRGEILGFF